MCYVRYGYQQGEKLLYVLIGGNSTEFWRFDTQSDTWYQCANTLTSQTWGASITPRSWCIPCDRLYAIMGGSDSALYMYYPPRDSWIKYPPEQKLPRLCGAGSHIVREESPYITLIISGEYDTTNFYKNLEVSEDENVEEMAGEMGSGFHRSEPEEGMHLTRSGREAHLHYVLNVPCPVTAEVFDATGRKVKTLFRGKQGKGAHLVTWNFIDENGRRVSAGVFFFSLDLTEKRATLKLPVW